MRKLYIALIVILLIFVIIPLLPMFIFMIFGFEIFSDSDDNHAEGEIKNGRIKVTLNS